MTTSAARDSRNRAILTRSKNVQHTCADCDVKVDQHPLGRSAHDRMAIHTATVHHKYLERDCQGGACKASPFTPRERRG